MGVEGRLAAAPAESTGLYHVAIRYPDRETLAGAVKRVLEAGIPLDRRFRPRRQRGDLSPDPDGNGVELYADRPRDQWPEEMYTAPLDLHGLLAEAT